MGNLFQGSIMKQLLIGILLGSMLASAPALAFHYFGHDQGADDLNRLQQQQERFNQDVERQRQEQFRNRQPC